MKQIYKLTPVFKNYIWGGNKLVRKWNKNSSLNTIAESWELSVHKDGECLLEDGQAFTSILTESSMGTNCEKFDKFPILIKLIDAKEKLSIQVHPDDSYALANENDLGKTEMWYIADCEDNAGIYLGFNRQVKKQEIESAIENNTIENLLNFIPVKKGESFLINAGTIHAIGAGVTICEIQQNSNVTYRVYDYDRKDIYGNKRELHVKKALDVLDYNKFSKPYNNENNILAKCGYFTVLKYKVTDLLTLTSDKTTFNAITVMEGNGIIENIKFVKGDTFFIPADYGDYKLSGNAEFILSKI